MPHAAHRAHRPSSAGPEEKAVRCRARPWRSTLAAQFAAQSWIHPGAAVMVRVAGMERAVDGVVIAIRVVGDRADDPVFIVAARTGRDGRLWERLVVPHRAVFAPAGPPIRAVAWPVCPTRLRDKEGVVPVRHPTPRAALGPDVHPPTLAAHTTPMIDIGEPVTAMRTALVTGTAPGVPQGDTGSGHPRPETSEIALRSPAVVRLCAS